MPNGSACHMPFFKDGIQHNSCIRSTLDSPKMCIGDRDTGAWGYCGVCGKMFCSSTGVKNGASAPKGKQCHFPFTHDGVTTYECLSSSRGNGEKWCYTDKQKKQWGFCQCGVRTCKYVLSKEEQDFDDSQATCEKMDGSLASIHSKEEWIEARKACDGHTCYLGMRRAKSEHSRDGWEWIDGTSVDYERWEHAGEGRDTGELRAAMKGWDAGWHDWGKGDDRLSAVCEVCKFTWNTVKLVPPKPKPPASSAPTFFPVTFAPIAPPPPPSPPPPPPPSKPSLSKPGVIIEQSTETTHSVTTTHKSGQSVTQATKKRHTTTEWGGKPILHPYWANSTSFYE